MSSVQFSSITTDEGQQFITAFASGRLLGPVDDSHPNFAAIKTAMAQSLLGLETVDPDELADLFDVVAAVARHFDSLSDRIKVANGRIYLDGDEVENALTKQIIRFMDEGVQDWKPLVAFFEKVLSNPNEHSREQLYNWLDKHDFTITESGDIVGYKGVTNPDNNGVNWSISRGREQVLVDGVAHTGQIPNPIGAEIEMGRSLVHHDPAVGCSVGLHVGTHSYASSFGQVCLEVHVNPRDVVSVPTHCNWQKVRCCRYKVVGEVERQYDVAVLASCDVDNAGDDDEAFTDLDVSIPSGDEGTTWAAGDRIRDEDGDLGTVVRGPDDDGDLSVNFDDYGTMYVNVNDATKVDANGDPYADVRGPKGQFTNGRPGSRRDGSTGRFA